MLFKKTSPPVRLNDGSIIVPTVLIALETVLDLPGAYRVADLLVLNEFVGKKDALSHREWLVHVG